MARQQQAKRARKPRYRRGIPGDYTERNKRIMELRAQDMSFEAIGQKFKPMLCGETVRLIVRRAERNAANHNSEKMTKLRAAFARGVTGRG
jgi:hypothetical protein